MKKRYMSVWPELIVATAMVIIGSISLHAVDQSKPSPSGALKITPLRTDIIVKPGETKTIDVTVTNPSDSEVAINAVVNDFMAGDEDGTPAIILDENKTASQRGLKQFVKPLGNLSLPAKQSKTISLQIEAPPTARPGGYFGALRISPSSPSDDSQVAVNASVASLILLRVSGDVAEKLSLAEFQVHQDDQQINFLSSGDDLAAYVRFVNSGDVQLDPIGKLSITKGDSIVYEIDFNNKTRRDMVLPDSARRWNIPLQKLDGLGQYTLSATFTYGSKNQTLSAEKTFWLIPYQVIIGMLAGMLLLVLMISILIMRKKRSRQKNIYRSYR